MKLAIKVGIIFLFITSCQPAIQTFNTKSGRTGVSFSIHTWGSGEKSEVVAAK